MIMNWQQHSHYRNAFEGLWNVLEKTKQRGLTLQSPLISATPEESKGPDEQTGR